MINMSTINNFYPFRGIDKISFGERREDIRENICETYRSILRNEFAENTSDYYESLGFFVEYNSDNICNAIEFTNDSNLYFDGIDLLKKSYQEFVGQYDQISKNKDYESDIGVTFYDLGFGAMKA
ncbi:MAG: hypothetical protein DSY77_11515, partial [Bacteroidetes bacterium]